MAERCSRRSGHRVWKWTEVNSGSWSASTPAAHIPKETTRHEIVGISDEMCYYSHIYFQKGDLERTAGCSLNAVLGLWTSRIQRITFPIVAVEFRQHCSRDKLRRDLTFESRVCWGRQYTTEYICCPIGCLVQACVYMTFYLYRCGCVCSPINEEVSGALIEPCPISFYDTVSLIAKRYYRRSFHWYLRRNRGVIPGYDVRGDNRSIFRVFRWISK